MPYVWPKKKALLKILTIFFENNYALTLCKYLLTEIHFLLRKFRKNIVYGIKAKLVMFWETEKNFEKELNALKILKLFLFENLFYLYFWSSYTTAVCRKNRKPTQLNPYDDKIVGLSASCFTGG